MYRFIRFFLLTFAALAFAYGFFVAAITPDTLQGNKEFEKSGFAAAINYVETIHRNSGRLPTASEFEAWKISQDWENRALFLETSGSLASEDCSFGAIPQGSYGLSVWRGEWFECYAAWIPSYSFDNTLRINLLAIALFLALGTLAIVAAKILTRWASRLTTQSRGPP